MMNVPITCDYYFVCKLIDSSKVISYLGGYSPFGPIDIIAVIHEHGSFFFFFLFCFVLFFKPTKLNMARLVCFLLVKK